MLANMSHFLLKSICLTSLLTIFLLPALAWATTQTLSPDAQAELDKQDQAFIGEVGLGADLSLGQIISRIIKIFLSFLGVVFIILIIYAGYLWLVSAGNAEKISKAKTIMFSALIGVTIVLMAYAITFFVIDKILEAARGGAGLG